MERSAYYADGDPWHQEDDQEDEYRLERGRSRVCPDCKANLDIDGHEPFCSQQEGDEGE